MAVKVTAASGSDLQGAKSLLEPLPPLLPRLKRLWGDSHYGGSLIEWSTQHLGWTVQVVRSLIAAATTLPSSEAMGKKEQKPSAPGFRILPRRWVVERSLAWITRLPSARPRS